MNTFISFFCLKSLIKYHYWVPCIEISNFVLILTSFWYYNYKSHYYSLHFYHIRFVYYIYVSSRTNDERQSWPGLCHTPPCSMVHAKVLLPLFWHNGHGDVIRKLKKDKNSGNIVSILIKLRFIGLFSTWTCWKLYFEKKIKILKSGKLAVRLIWQAIKF